MKCSVYMAVSVDGYIAKKDGNIEWLNKPEFAIEKINGLTYNEFISTVDAIIMGRNTFEKVLTFGFWPYEEVEVIVLTNKALTIPDELKGKVHKKSGEHKKIIEELKEEGKKHLYIDGGQTIQEFLKAGLVDEITLTIIPVLLGEGIPLFGTFGHITNLSLIESNTSKNGFVQLRYLIKKD